jgi:hypothetical protein
LRGVAEVGGVDDGDDRVAARRGVIGEHQDRLPVRRDLDRSLDQPLRRQLVVSRTGEHRP